MPKVVKKPEPVKSKTVKTSKTVKKASSTSIGDRKPDTVGKPSPKPEATPTSMLSPTVTPEKSTRILYRLYECQVKAEIAVSHLKGIGLFPGPSERAERLRTQTAACLASAESLLREYKKLWEEMSR